MAERKEWWEILRDQFASRGLLDPESERIQEAVSAAPAVKRQARGLLSLDPQAESDAVLEMGLGSLPGTGQLMALRDLERARRAKDPAAAAMAASNFIPFGTLLNRFRRGPMSELDVYHATPHEFSPTPDNPLGEFDASKIGTGEGAQAFGHGIYAAESPRTAQSYYDQFKQQIQGSTGDVTDRRLDFLMQEFGGDTQKAADRFMASVYDTPKNKEAMRKEVLRRLEARTKQPYMLKADLPDEMIDRMLDWDKPLSEQPAAVREALMPLVKGAMKKRGTPDNALEYSANRALGSDIVNNLLVGNGAARADVSQKLRQAGIPGIRYLDRESRIYGKPKFFVENVSADGKVINSFRFDTKEEAERFSATFKKQMKGQLPPEKIGTPRITEREAQQTTSNFVVFPGEEKKVKILERK
jgi:hypothetical protein